MRNFRANGAASISYSSRLNQSTVACPCESDPPFDLWHNIGACVDKTAKIQKQRCLSIPLACCVDDERSPPFRGASDPSSGGLFHAPRSPSRSSAPVLSPAPRGAAVWGGRRATARPREAKWISGVAAVFGYVITGMFSKIHLDITTTEEHFT